MYGTTLWSFLSGADEPLAADHAGFAYASNVAQLRWLKDTLKGLDRSKAQPQSVRKISTSLRVGLSMREQLQDVLAASVFLSKGALL